MYVRSYTYELCAVSGLIHQDLLYLNLSLLCLGVKKVLFFFPWTFTDIWAKMTIVFKWKWNQIFLWRDSASCFVKAEPSEGCRQHWCWITRWQDIWHHNPPQTNTYYFPLIRTQLLRCVCVYESGRVLLSMHCTVTLRRAGVTEAGQDGRPHIWHSHGNSERHRAGPARALHCTSQHPEKLGCPEWQERLCKSQCSVTSAPTHTHTQDTHVQEKPLVVLRGRPLCLICVVLTGHSNVSW